MGAVRWITLSPICAVSPRASSGMASGVSGASVRGQDRLNGRQEQWIDGGDGMNALYLEGLMETRSRW